MVSVIADENIRADRIEKRDNISKEEVLKRFSSQLSEDFFKENSDFIIENNGGIDSVVFQTISIINIIKEQFDVSQQSV
ncbi:MAG: dephospho-CoA kinase [Oscillospiraceae bacterium]|nr:dephospho-CoA kinase [Oscillospiraceae bacterium]